MTKSQRAKRKHGTTKDREKGGGSNMFLKKWQRKIYTTHKYGSIHATRKPGRHWDWRGINKELALASVWIRAIGTIGGLFFFFLITGLSPAREGRGNRDWSPTDRVCIYFFISHPFWMPFYYYLYPDMYRFDRQWLSQGEIKPFLDVWKFLFIFISDIDKEMIGVCGIFCLFFSTRKYLHQILQIDLLSNFILHSIWWIIFCPTCRFLQNSSCFLMIRCIARYL